LARRIAYVVATGVLATFGVLAGAPAAWAHATLVATSPADGAILRHGPARVSATFDESVGVSTDSLKVFAPDGSRVDTGGTSHGRTPQQITVALRTGLGRGTYTVGWHVISADSHPVQGAFTFSVGAPSSTAVNPATLGRSAGTLVGVAFGIARWLAFCCFALLVGAVWFLIWCWPAGASSPLVLRLTMGAWGGLASSVLAAILLQGVYGAGQGVGHVFWPNVLHATLYSRYGRALGIRLLLVIAALFVFTMTLGTLRADDRRSRVIAGVAWGVLTAGLAATWAVADHAGTGIQVPLSVPSAIIHLSAVAIWQGGLAMLITIVLRRPRPPRSGSVRGAAKRRGQAVTAEAAQAVARFSPLALGCVTAIVATGTYQAWRGVGSWGALTSTTYGRLLLVKITAMCVLISLGYLARIRVAALRAPSAAVPFSAARLIPAGLLRAGVGARSAEAGPGLGVLPRPGNGASYPGNDAPEYSGNGTPAYSGNGAPPRRGNGTVPGRRGAKGARPASGAAGDGSSPDVGHMAVTLAKLRWSVAAEALIAASVLAVTALLVNTPTARETFISPASATVAFNTGGPGGHGSISVIVTPAGLGPNQVRVTITGSRGGPYAPRQVQASLSLPARHLGPLNVPLTPDGRGRYAGGPVTVTVTGQWQLRITIRSDAFDETTVAVPVTIR
jgi:copper transport protein